MRNLVVVLGDQLSLSSVAFDGFDAARDRVWMAEVREESEHVPSTKMRTAIFLSAMRHFAEALTARGMPLDYLKLGAHPFASIESALADTLARHRPETVLMVEAGEWRLEQAIANVCRASGVQLALRDDLHFMASRAEFAEHAQGKRRLVMENFYRHMRMKHKVLMDDEGQPEGGQWNFDHDNRGAFGREGPGLLPAPPSFAPDAITREVLAEVELRFGDHYGSASSFDWPVTREQALVALADFVEHRLQDFGRFQDAMWADEPFLYHGLLSSSMNLKLLDPREVIDAAVARWRTGAAPIEAVEGFVRQIIGWREFMRGVYWWRMPKLLEANALKHQQDLPGWYWTGEVHMNCMRQAIGQTLRTGYAHHIQRLMVTGNFALTFGVAPAQVHAWYLSVYVDAVEWVELPNTVGMSLFADGARFVTKPYAAGGAYIRRMSNYCDGCRYQPGTRSGEGACPMTVMYWDFVARHERMLENNPRTVMMTRNLGRFSDDERAAIRRTAADMRAHPDLL
ncbi:cryptochrome/photolyase family protein [Variovorax sp. KK3]|uniref:cryptochrome/photolyase family protein n=1 Tax=Variovorax sp. KK3 TaxID=1855728 RepID=UPI00097C721E|nr:cryptochrome/photolyase family protein [Variovorax sp. KK3]